MSAKQTPANKTPSRLVAGVAVLAVLVASLWFCLRSSPFKIAVTFAGFTNNAATFVVANHGSCRAFQTGECDYQIQGDSGLRWGGGGIQELMLYCRWAQVAYIGTLNCGGRNLKVAATEE